MSENNKPVFSYNDVIALAKAVLVGYYESDYGGNYYCNFCSAKLDGYKHTLKDFKHDLDCPILIAQNVIAQDVWARIEA